MRSYNNLSLSIFNGTTALPDIERNYLLAQDVSFETFYPGGLYGSASFTLPHNPRYEYALNGGMRVQIHNNLTLVYEGYIEEITPGETGLEIGCTGAWGYYLGRRYSFRKWADKRMDSRTWYVDAITSTADKFTVDYHNRIGIVPKNVSITNGQGVNIYYNGTIGEKVYSMTFTYDFKEGAQQWEMRLYSSTNLSSFTLEDSITATGSGTKTVTLGTPRRYLALQMYNNSGGAQTPASDGTIYCEWTNITVYSTLDSADTPGTFNMDVLLADVSATLTAIDTDTTFITSNTLSLVPFIASKRGESYADIISRAAAFGNANNNEWGVQLLSTDKSVNTLPIFRAATYPTLGDYDFSVDLTDSNNKINHDFSEIYNYIIVQYTDANDIDQVLHPLGDTTLTDATSVSLYGQRDKVIRLSNTQSSTTAANYGRRFLAKSKEPRWYIQGALSVSDYAESKNGVYIPASEIQARQRLLLRGYPSDISTRPYIAWISRTRYNHNTRTTQIYTTTTDPQAVEFARLQGRLNN